MPDSMSSTMMRLALVRLVFASDFTRRATRAGSVTLWRTLFSVMDITSFYTVLHQRAPAPRNGA